MQNSQPPNNNKSAFPIFNWITHTRVPEHDTLPTFKMMSEDELIALFTRVGIEPSRISATVKNSKFASALADTIREAGCEEAGAEKAVGVLLDGLAGTLPAAAISHRPFLAKKIAKRDLKTDEQLQGT